MRTKRLRNFTLKLFVGVYLPSIFLYSYSIRDNMRSIAYKQVRIPLNNQSGIAYRKGDDGIYIEGFDIDSNENFYFLGGTRATLTCFSKYGSLIYKKAFSDHYPGPMHIVRNKLFFFETWNGLVNNLIQVDKTNGRLTQAYPNTITAALKSGGYKTLNGYQFSDSTLSITFDQGGGPGKFKRIYFNLKGQVTPDLINFPPDSLASGDAGSIDYLGKVGGDLALGKFDMDRGRYNVALRDGLNNVIADSSIELKYLGAPLCGFVCMPQEHRKLRNNKLYILNKDKNMAVITEIDLSNFLQR